MSKKMKTAPVRVVALVPTSDDWYPNLNAEGKPDRHGKHVRVSFLELLSAKGWRVCIWGGDDCGMERDFQRSDKGEAKALYKLLVGGGVVTRKDLEALGFQLS